MGGSHPKCEVCRRNILLLPRTWLTPKAALLLLALLLPTLHLTQTWLSPSSSLLSTLTEALSLVNLHPCTVLCASRDRCLLMYISQPVVLVRGTGRSFARPAVFAHIGTKALESTTARFQSCFSDYYVYNITSNGLLPLSHTQSPQLKNVFNKTHHLSVVRIKCGNA